ncbi:MAG: penicillin-binding protein 1C [Hyphomicrobiaceae bacterium]|nr:penicillin-binding protein 1C [Hyphomicrobiaceae bacterium]
MRAQTITTRWLMLAATLLLLVPLSVYGAVRLAMAAMGPPPLAAAAQVSVTVVDRDGDLLRAFTTAQGRWRLPVEPADVDQRYLAMLIAFEDRRFRSHGGIDPLAVARAGYQLVRHGRIISGASTLTMQVARLLEGEHDRTLAGKWRQAVRALQLEERLQKNEILGLYLRLAPFGGNLEGARAASLAYFGKEPRRLSIGESALLVALPQSPELRRPDRFPEAARRARDRVLARATAAGVITSAEAERGRGEAVPHVRREFPKLAPHLSESEVLLRPLQSVHRLTLSRELQGQLETLAREHARALGRQLSASVLVVDNGSGEVLAHVGSSDYLDEARLGAIDMVGATRSPGSTLKPVIYGLAFEAGLAHPETLIEDRPARFGLYAPRNFDEEFRGSVTIREALAHSLNIPAVKALNAVGPARLVSRFRRAGVSPALPGDEEPTLAIALGGIGLSLRDLAGLYAALARGGEAIEPWHRRGTDERAAALRSGPPKRLLSPAAAWYVGDILKDAPPPAGAAGGRFAYKTGTSYGYRDAWAIGYDGRHTVAVWVGRADGASTPALTGRVAAAPLLFDAFRRLGPERASLRQAPAGVLRVSGAQLPPPLKRFAEPGEDRLAPGPYLDPPVLIAFPPDRSELELEAGDDLLLLKADGGVLPLTWMVDGMPIASAPHRREAAWQPEGRGFVKLTVTDANGRVDRVTVRLR